MNEPGISRRSFLARSGALVGFEENNEGAYQSSVAGNAILPSLPLSLRQAPHVSNAESSCTARRRWLRRTPTREACSRPGTVRLCVRRLPAQRATTTAAK